MLDLRRRIRRGRVRLAALACVALASACTYQTFVTPPETTAASSSASVGGGGGASSVDVSTSSSAAVVTSSMSSASSSSTTSASSSASAASSSSGGGAGGAGGAKPNGYLVCPSKGDGHLWADCDGDPTTGLDGCEIDLNAQPNCPAPNCCDACPGEILVCAPGEGCSAKTAVVSNPTPPYPQGSVWLSDIMCVPPP
jgi:hypothetical protein